MRFVLFCFALLVVPLAFADGGIADAGQALDAGHLVVDAGVADVAVPLITIESAAGSAKGIYEAVKVGNWWWAAAALLVLVVGLIRKFGKLAHDALHDDSVWDKPFAFLFDSKVGGWLLNIATAMAGGLGTALAAGATVDIALWKSIALVSFTGVAMIEAKDDFSKPKKAEPLALASSEVPTKP